MLELELILRISVVNICESDFQKKNVNTNIAKNNDQLLIYCCHEGFLRMVRENRYKYFGLKLFPPEANPNFFKPSILEAYASSELSASLFYCKEEEYQHTGNVVNTVCIPLISLCGNATHIETKHYT